MVSGWAIFGAIATAMGLFRGLPQLVLLLRSRDAHGVSPDTAATTTIVSGAWTLYGIATAQYSLAVASGSTAVVFGCITLAALRFGRRIAEIRAALVWTLVLLAVAVAAGIRGVGLALPISVLIANVPQILVAARERDLRALSLGTWLLSTVEGAAWATYGLLTRDPAVALNGTLQSSTSAAIAALRYAKR
jgi:uncharacterized protein with PQ loop repeat